MRGFTIQDANCCKSLYGRNDNDALKASAETSNLLSFFRVDLMQFLFCNSSCLLISDR